MGYDVGKWDAIDTQVTKFEQAHQQESYFVAIKARGPGGDLQVRCLSSNPLLRGLQYFGIWLTKPRGSELIYGRAHEDKEASRMVLGWLGSQIAKESATMISGKDVDRRLAWMQRHQIKTLEDIDRIEAKVAAICARHAKLAVQFTGVGSSSADRAMASEREFVLQAQLFVRDLKGKMETIEHLPNGLKQAGAMSELLDRYMGDTRYIEYLDAEEFALLTQSLQALMQRLAKGLQAHAKGIEGFDQGQLREFQHIQAQFQSLQAKVSKSVAQASSKSWVASQLEQQFMQALGLVERAHLQEGVRYLERQLAAKGQDADRLREEIAVRAEEQAHLESMGRAHRQQVLGDLDSFREDLLVCESPAFNAISDDVRGSLQAVRVKFEAYQAAMAQDELALDTFMSSGWIDSLNGDIGKLEVALAQQPLQAQEQVLMGEQAQLVQELAAAEKKLDQAFDQDAITQQAIDQFTRAKMSFGQVQTLNKSFTALAPKGLGQYVDHMLALDKEEAFVEQLRAMTAVFAKNQLEFPPRLTYVYLRNQRESLAEALQAREAFEQLRALVESPAPLSDELYAQAVDSLRQKYSGLSSIQELLAEIDPDRVRNQLTLYDRITTQDVESAKRAIQEHLAKARKQLGQMRSDLVRMEQEMGDSLKYRWAVDQMDKLLSADVRAKLPTQWQSDRDYDAWDIDRWGLVQKALRGKWRADEPERAVFEAAFTQLMDASTSVQGLLSNQARREQLQATQREQKAHIKELKQQCERLQGQLGEVQGAYRALIADRHTKVARLKGLMGSLRSAREHSKSAVEAHRQLLVGHQELSALQRQKAMMQTQLQQQHEWFAHVRQAQTLTAFNELLQRNSAAS